MAYTHDDLLAFQQLSGISPEQSASYFGVELPKPPPPPAPAPEEEKPILVAGNTPKTAQPALGGLYGFGGWDEQGKPISPNEQASDAPVVSPEVDAIARSRGLTPHAKREDTQQLHPYFSRDVTTPDGLVMRPAVEPEKKIAPVADADMNAAQALERGALGPGGGVAPSPIRVPGLASHQSEAELAMGKTGRDKFNVADAEKSADRAAVDYINKQAEVIAAPAVEYALAEEKLRQVGDQITSLRAQDEAETNAAAAEVKRLREEYQKNEKPTEAEKLSTGFAYALAAIGQMFGAAGGKNVDYVAQVAKIQSDAADRRFAKSMEAINGVKADAATKEKLRARALAHDMAYRENIERALGMAVDRMKAVGGGQLTEAQAEAERAARDSLRATNAGKEFTAVELTKRAMRARDAAAAAASRINIGQAEKEMKTFVPTGGGGQGFIAYDEGSATKARELVNANNKLNTLYEQQKRDVAELAKQGITDRFGNAISGDTALVDRIHKRELDIAATENVLAGGGAMSKDEQETRMKTRSIGNATSLRGKKVEAYIENLNQLQQGLQGIRTGIDQTFGNKFGRKEMLPDGRVIFIPQTPGQTLPTFGGAKVKK